jgi:hypothetical protein
MRPISSRGSQIPHGYCGQLDIPGDLYFDCQILMKLAWRYVIKQRKLLAQQEGQRRIIRNLREWHFDNPDLCPAIYGMSAGTVSLGTAACCTLHVITLRG